MKGMQNDRLKKIRSRVANENALILALLDKLPNTTPYLKKRLEHASSLLNDVETFVLPSIAKAQPPYTGMWFVIAEFDLSMASQIRQKVQSLFDQYGPNIQEIG